MKILTVEEMIAAERAADEAGSSYAQLMETAGKRTAEAIVERVSVEGKPILILVGPGNNGGDGLVAGRYLAEAGADVAFYLTKPRNNAQDPNYAKIQEMGLLTIKAAADPHFRVLQTRLTNSDILIDALLGTGSARPISGELAKMMQHVHSSFAARRNAASKTVPPKLITLIKNDKITPSPPHPLTSSPPHPLTVAIDCPSGLNCNTGALDPLTLPADLTVTYGAPKWGHFLFPGAGVCGELVVADIGIDPELPEMKNIRVELVTSEMAQGLLPKRPLDGHKGTFGKVAIVAGCDQYRGAPILAAKGAFRAGAGLVALHVPNGLRDIATGQLPEATFPPVSEADLLGQDAAMQLLKTASQYKAILIGPGLGDAKTFLIPFLEGMATIENKPPLIIDADGLNILATHPDWPKMLPSKTILTPHPAEMARLMDISLTAMKTLNRIETALFSAQEWGHIVLLKGAYTVIAAPDGQVRVLPFAAPILAVGGSGDVLSGVICSLLGQGLGSFEATVLGGYLHGSVGQLAEQEVGLLASEIADTIAEAIDKLYLYKNSS